MQSYKCESKTARLVWSLGVFCAASGTAFAATGGVTNHVWTAGGRFYSSPAIGPNGIIHVGSTNGMLYAFNPDGATQRVWQLPNKIFSSPAIGTNGIIYVGCDDYNLYGLHPNGTTQHVWATGGRIVNIPAIGSDGTIYAASQDNKLYAFNPDGTTQRVWNIPNSSSYLVSSPTISSNGMICVGGYSSNVFLFNPDGTTQMVWHTSYGFEASPAFGSDGAIYIGDKYGFFYAFNPDGTTQHVWKISGGFYSSAAIGEDGTIYVGDRAAHLYAFNPDGTTQRVWTLSSSGYDIYSSPAVGSDGTIYVGCDNYNFYALNPDGTTNIVWNLGGRIQGSPAIGLDGTVYIGQYDGVSFFALQGTGGRLADAPWPKFGQNMQNTCRALAPPPGLQAVNPIGTADIVLSWSNEPFATGYKVYRGINTNSAAATLLGSTSALSYTNNNAPPVLTNYYWVRSTNAVFTSAYGAYIEKTRPILPVTNISATQGQFTNEVVVSWTPSPDAGKYALFASTNPFPASAVLICETNATRYCDDMAPAGVPVFYWVRVRAFGALSPWSPRAVGWIGAARLFASDGAHSDKVAVGWDAVAGAEGYEILRGTNHDIAAAASLTATNALVYDDTSATAGVYYYYWARATNSAGMSLFSAYDRGWRATGSAPGAPSGLSASDGAYTDKVALAWSEPAEAAGYTVWRGTTTNSAAATQLAAVSVPEYNDTGAAVGTVYYYWVKATNSYGASPFSASDSGWRAAGVAPAAPSELSASDGTYSNKIAVTWRAVEGATGYSVWRSTGGDSASAELIGTSSATNYNDTAVEAETMYCYWVKATNSYGSSAFSASDWGWRTGCMPGVPSGLSASDGAHKDKVALSWSAAPYAARYQVWRSTNSMTASASLLATTEATSYNDVSAEPEIVYYYWVKGTNAYGAGGFSTPDSGWRASSMPGVPTGLTASDGTYDNRVALGWNASTNAEGYCIRRAITNDIGSSLLLAEGVNNVFYNDSSAQAGVRYWYWVRATNAYGESAYSSPDEGWMRSAAAGICAINDYNGDRRSDCAVFDQNTGWWFVIPLNSATPLAWAFPWGWPGAWPVPGDYDGDGVSDCAVFDQNTGWWFVIPLNSATPLAWAFPWGWPGAWPVPGDYDGDGQSDCAVFDQNTGWWFVISLNGTTPLAWAFAWGWPGAWPVPGDYDGDGVSDCAVFDQNTGWWFVIPLNSATPIAWAFAWGWPGAWPVPGDYDGDGKSDCAVFDQNTGWWFVINLNGTTPLAWAFPWGWPGAWPVPGDYDGDGKADCAVFDQNTGWWFVIPLNGTTPIAWAFPWGWPGAWPVGWR